jgi:hypothetical protein
VLLGLARRHRRPAAAQEAAIATALMSLVLATRNAPQGRGARAMLTEHELVGLPDHLPPEETGDTFALERADQGRGRRRAGVP